MKAYGFVYRTEICAKRPPLIRGASDESKDYQLTRERLSKTTLIKRRILSIRFARFPCPLWLFMRFYVRSAISRPSFH